MSWSEEVHTALAAAGLRRGEARERVIGLLEEQRCALSAAEIERRLADVGQPTGRASIYRVLELLADRGLLERVEVGDGQARYEPAREHHHHHLLCEGCGALVAFDDPELERAIMRLSRRLGVAVTGHEVLLRGACAGCN
jgi:Fur family transcriptional regulator, ferric uptake regulator